MYRRRSVCLMPLLICWSVRCNFDHCANKDKADVALYFSYGYRVDKNDHRTVKLMIETIADQWPIGHGEISVALSTYDESEYEALRFSDGEDRQNVKDCVSKLPLRVYRYDNTKVFGHQQQSRGARKMFTGRQEIDSPKILVYILYVIEERPYDEAQWLKKADFYNLHLNASRDGANVVVFIDEIHAGLRFAKVMTVAGTVSCCATTARTLVAQILDAIRGHLTDCEAAVSYGHCFRDETGTCSSAVSYRVLRAGPGGCCPTNATVNCPDGELCKSIPFPTPTSTTTTTTPSTSTSTTTTTASTSTSAPVTITETISTSSTSKAMSTTPQITSRTAGVSSAHPTTSRSARTSFTVTVVEVPTVATQPPDRRKVTTSRAERSASAIAAAKRQPNRKRVGLALILIALAMILLISICIVVVACLQRIQRRSRRLYYPSMGTTTTTTTSSSSAFGSSEVGSKSLTRGSPTRGSTSSDPTIDSKIKRHVFSSRFSPPSKGVSWQAKKAPSLTLQSYTKKSKLFK